jgi:cytochrome P450
VLLPVDPELADEVRQRKTIELFTYAQDLSRSKREHPTDDVWTTLSNAELEGEQLSENELDYFFMLLTAAGSETTRNAERCPVMA